MFGPGALAVGILLSSTAAGLSQSLQTEQKPPAGKKAAEKDPFADVQAGPSDPAVQPDKSGRDNWLQRFTSENFVFRSEVYSQLTGGHKVEQEPPVYSRQSLGFELLKKFSTDTATVAALDVQFRLVRRDHYIMVANDMEGADRTGFYPEYHNVYLDFYNVFNPLMGDSARSRHVGRFNLRVGRFYLPFGINLQTDTHGTVLQLSNDRNFGFDRDWYTGFYGSLNRNVNYDVYYLLGSGYYPRFKGQQGLLGARISLGNRFLNEFGLEGGVAFLGGERICEAAVMRSPSVEARSSGHQMVRTLRAGIDGRYTHPLSHGTLALTTELSGGQDASDTVFTDLNQLEYLSRSRRWGAAGQYRHFWQNIRPAPEIRRPDVPPGRTDSSLAGEFTWYFRNDISASRLHWLKFNVERQLERLDGARTWLFTVQYYWYW